MILVVGASGSLGGKIVRGLLERREVVRALVRPGRPHRPIERDGATVVVGDLRDRLSLDRACEGATAVVTTASASKTADDSIENIDVRGNENLIAAAEAAAVERFVFISTLNASAGSPVPVFRAKGMTEQRLRQSRLVHTILQPNAFMDVWFPMLVERPAFSGQPVTLVGESRRRHAFIAERDVAAFAVSSLIAAAARNATLPLGGPEAALALARSREREGGGAEEKASPSCPASSEVGTVEVGAGAGPTPYYAQGRAYLAGPYEGAPLSLAILTPAVAGPYDLGTVLVRTALHIDPETARVTATSDPIPHVLDGIPLDLRSVAVKLDRSLFTLNPTNCSPFSFDGEAITTLGQVAPLSDHFQVGECKRLRFQPHLSLRLTGGSARGAHPALRSVLTYPKGAYANIASASVALPHSEFLAQEHIRTVCTRVQFAAHACPKGSIYGHATATSPLVDYKVRGPIYLRSSSHPLPDLVLALRGPDSQPVEVDAVARIDSHHGGIRATFGSIPDLPVSKVVLSMPSGAKGLLVNSTNLCKGTHRASAHLTAQNAKFINLKPALRVKCRKKR